MSLNILFLHGLTAVVGGAERDLLLMTRQLPDCGVTPFVGCPREGPLVQELAKQGTKVIALDFPPWRKPRFFASRLPAIYRLYQVIAREGIHLMHINEMWWTPLGYCAARLAGIPSVAHIRQEVEARRVRQYWLRYPTRVIAVSKAVSTVLERAEVKPSNLMVLYTGVDLQAAQASLMTNGDVIGGIHHRYRMDQNSPVIGTVAHLFPRKGHEYLIQAVSQVRQAFPTIRCLIVGEGDPAYAAELRALAGSLGLHEQIIFTGFQDSVYPYLESMDVFVLPSVMEGFGIVLLEAMAMGKPIVASCVGGIPEVVDDGVTGLLVPPRDSSAMADAVIRLLRNRQMRQEMGDAGIRRVRSQFSVEQMSRTLQELYRSLLSGSPRAGQSPI